MCIVNKIVDNYPVPFPRKKEERESEFVHIIYFISSK